MSLAIVYAGAALAPKMLTSGVAGRCPALISMILVDQVEQVQLLALVLMQTLGLDVEHCIRVNGDVLRAVQPVGQCALVLRLDGGELLQNIDIFRVRQQFSSSVASLRKPEPMSFSISAVSAGSHSSSQRRKVMPLVLLLNFSG